MPGLKARQVSCCPHTYTPVDTRNDMMIPKLFLWDDSLIRLEQFDQMSVWLDCLAVASPYPHLQKKVTMTGHYICFSKRFFYLFPVTLSVCFWSVSLINSWHCWPGIEWDSYNNQVGLTGSSSFMALSAASQVDFGSSSLLTCNQNVWSVITSNFCPEMMWGY